MSANLPITWLDKKNSPELEAFLKQYGDQYCMKAEEINQLRDAVNEMAVIQQSTFLGAAEPAFTPAGTGRAYWVAVKPGTYANHGGVIVAANEIAFIIRDAVGAFSISKTGLDLSGYLKIVDGNKINTWTAKAYLSGDQVNYLGKDWVSNAVTVAGDIPGTSAKWVERLTGYLKSNNIENKANLEVGKNLFNKATVVNDFWLNPQNETLIADNTFCYSDFMPVLPNTQYKNSPQGYTVLISYDSNKKYVTGADFVTGVLTGANVYYVKMCFKKIELNTKQFEAGAVSTTYEDYSLLIPTKELLNAFSKSWIAKIYLKGETVNYLGKDWVANVGTISTDIPNTSNKWDERLTAYANKKDAQNLVFSSAIQNLNIDAYKSIGSFRSNGVYDNFSYNNCIKDYPINYATQKFIFIKNIIGVDERYLCFFDSAGVFIATSPGAPAVNIKANQDKVLAIPPNAVKFGCTLVTNNVDSIPSLSAVLVFTGLFDTDFVIDKINGFSLKGSNGGAIDTTTFLTKTEGNATYSLKSTTETQLATNVSNINANTASIASTNTDIALVKNKLDALNATPPTAGAITGNNVFTGNNTFAQPIKSVAAINDDEVIRKGEYKKTLNRYEDAADYGFLPSATATANVAALNAALLGGNKTLTVSKPGIYLMDATVYLDDYTNLIFGRGVILKKVAWYMIVLVNRGAITRSLNTNITIKGCKIMVNGYKNAFTPTDSMYGLSGNICFFHINNLQIFDTEILDIADSNWGIQVCTFSNLHINGFVLKGNKDGIHLGRGKTFLIENGICDTYDDAVALNGHDYPSCNPEVGNIEDGIIRNVTDLYKSPTTGYFSRLLIGAWVDWYSGIQLQKGDAIVNNGKTYRIEGVSGTSYNSAVFPTIPSGQNSVVASEGFTLILCSNDAVYSANIINVKYENIKCYSNRNVLAVELDFGSNYNRSLHPTVPLINYPSIEVNVQNLVSTTTATMMGIPANITSTVILEKCKTNGQLLAQSSSLKSKIIIDKCDFRNIIGAVLNLAGADLILKDSVTNTPINIAIGTGTRVRTTDNLLSITNLAPIKGDFITQNYIPKIYNGSVWVDQI